MDAIEKGVNDVRSKNKECKNMKYMRIDGSTPPKQREENVNAFQNEENCRVRGCSLRHGWATVVQWPGAMGQRSVYVMRPHCSSTLALQLLHKSKLVDVVQAGHPGQHVHPSFTNWSPMYNNPLPDTA